MCIFHKWGRWSEYSIYLPARQITKKWMLLPATERRQRKACKRCGKVKDELITINVTKGNND